MTAGVASEENETSRDAAEAPRLVGLSTAPLVVAPIRIGLGLLGMAGATLRGLSWSVAAAEFVLGTAVFAFAALADPRRHFFRLKDEAEPVPADATFEPIGRVALLATYPSTVGLAALTGVSLAFNAALAAVLAGGVRGWALRARSPAHRSPCESGRAACAYTWSGEAGDSSLRRRLASARDAAPVLGTRV